MGAAKFTSVRLFVVMCYEVYDQSATAFKTVYAIGSQGVEQADYAIYMRNYSEI
jgi:hypothetical protein